MVSEWISCGAVTACSNANLMYRVDYEAKKTIENLVTR